MMSNGWQWMGLPLMTCICCNLILIADHDTPDPCSHLQNFFIVRVRCGFVQDSIWQAQRCTFYFGVDQKCWHQQLRCKGIRLPFFP